MKPYRFTLREKKFYDDMAAIGIEMLLWDEGEFKTFLEIARVIGTVESQHIMESIGKKWGML